MMMLFSTSLIAAIALLNFADQSHAWAPNLIHRRQTFSSEATRLFSTVGKEGKSYKRRRNQEHEYDLEQTRDSLEALMQQSSSVTEEAEKSLNILTSAGRRRRQLEMDLLRQLYDDGKSSDQEEGQSRAVDELMHLWMYEHDAESAMQLEAMQVTCSPGMVIEEQQLRDMCDQFPTWAEPRARLAILYFMKGLSQEAYDTALEALSLKPWHFEVYSVLVMICLRHENMAQALYWARRSLPNHRPNEGNARRRKAWVDWALAQAAEQWELAEQETLEQERRRGAIDGACTSNGDDTWQ